MGGTARHQRGTTIIELMMVLTIIGILATLATPSYYQSAIKAKETALKHNLFTMRDLLDQYRTDRGKYPSNLAELTAAGYLRGIPVDPFTKSDGTWQEILDQAESGVFDVHSGSDLVSPLNGTPYNQW
ncbi:MAG: prepilin-type N-terminal cleavage/methylation domain-containing protein [Nitrospirae bacterium]|nr:MAG: prepilin-type N-terminal cleavage/methylation domain-containing protein [Nitrospirota bacterium]